jgi:hypothetical protein
MATSSLLPTFEISQGVKRVALSAGWGSAVFFMGSEDALAQISDFRTAKILEAFR